MIFLNVSFSFFYKQISDPNRMVVVQMDFVQNFSLILQREVQSAHFDKPQVTVFTASVMLGSESKNFVMISDYLEHVRSISDCSNEC